MGSPRLHWTNEPPNSFGGYIGVCTAPFPPQQLANRIEDVTCRKCQTALLEPGPDLTLQYVEEKFEIRPLTEYAPREEWKVTDPCVDDSTGLPFLDRDTWLQTKRCSLDRACGHCNLCRHFKATERHPSDGDSYRRRTAEPDSRIDLGTIEATLTWYADWRECGQHAKPGLSFVTRLEGIPLIRKGESPWTYRQEALALLSVSQNAPFDDATDYTTAVRAHRVEQTLDRMYLGGGRLPRKQSFQSLFARLVGVRRETSLGPKRYPMSASEVGEFFGVTSGQVGKIVERGRRDYVIAIRELAQERVEALAAVRAALEGAA